MEDYPEAFTARGRPLLVVAGFVHAEDGALPERLRNGPVIEGQGPGLKGDYAESLLDQFLSFDVHKQKSSNVASNALQFHIRPASKVGGRAPR